MKRVLVLTVGVLLVLPVIGSAKDMTGKWGLGYFNSDAPVGVRFWATPKLGVDLGVGFDAREVLMEGATDTTKETATSFWVEAGFPYVVFPGDRANFFIRPGIIFASLDDRAYGTGALDETWSVVTASATLGAEVFFGEHFTLEAGHGISVTFETPPEAVSDESYMHINTFDASVTYLGFHFYFK